MLYLILIIGATLLIALVNILCNAFGEAWWYLLLASVLATIAVILVDGIVAIIIRRLPEKWFNYQNKRFDVSKKETHFYECIGIKKWKDLIPELGGFTDFHKNHVEDPKDPKYLSRFMLEACYGVLIHEISYPLGFLVLLLDYRMYYCSSMIWLTVLVPVAITNLICCMLPAITLRYNLPKLNKMKQFAERKASRTKES